MTTFAAELENKCRRIARNLQKQHSEPGPASFLAREMALLLDQLDEHRHHRRIHLKQLMKRELELGTQILNLESRPDLVPDWQQRTRLVNEARRTLDQLHAQTHRVRWDAGSVEQRIHARLLELRNMHDQLSDQHGNS